MAQSEANRDSVLQQLLDDYPSLHLADSLAISNKDEDVLHYKSSFYKGITDLKKEGKWEQILQVTNKVSKQLRRREDYDGAIQILTKALSFATKLPDHHIEIAYTYDNLGIAHRQKGNYEQALDDHSKALNIFKTNYGENDRRLTSTYYNIGNIYYIMGNYLEASRYNQTVLNIQQKHYNELHPVLATTLSNIGLNDINLGFYAQAIEKYQKALQIQERMYPPTHPKVVKIASTYTSLATAYALKNDDEAALDASQKALNILERTIEASHPDVSINQNIIGDIYLKRKNYQQARLYYEKALINRKNVLGEKHPKMAESYSKIGQIYVQQKNYKKALSYYQQAIIALVETFDDKNIHANPKLKNIISETTLLKVMHIKAQILRQYYKATNDLTHLKNSLETYELASELITQVGNLYKTYDDYQTFDFNDRLPIYEDGIRVGLQLHRLAPEEQGLSTAFQLVEQSQYTDLMADLRSPKLDAFQGIDNSHLKDEMNKKIELTFYKEQFLKEQQKGEAADSQKLKKLEHDFRSSQAKQDNVLHFFQQNHPAYYHLKYGALLQTLPNIQQQLKKHLPQTAIIQYFIGKNSLYVFTITPEKARVQLLALNFQDVVANLFEAITNYELISGSPERAYQSYTNNAYALYELILEDAIQQLAGQHIQQLLIIPDGILNHVPFEALLTKFVPSKDIKYEDIDYSTLPYLIENYTISYSYIAATVFQQIQKGRSHLSPYIGFGTTYDKDQLAISEDALVSNLARETTPELNSAEREIELSADIMGGDQQPNIQATTEKFRAMAAHYNIVHLALHTVINDTDPIQSKTVFARSRTTNEDRYLTINEIYSTPFAADLSLFSAVRVQHKRGSDKTGLGLQHFIHALNYAGSESVVFSLWRTDDKAALSLTTEFFKQIKQQQPIPQALHFAKKNFLKQENRIRTHPYFWAGFMLFGNPQPLNTRNSWLLYLLLGGSCLLIGVGAYIWQQGKL